jgi:hypothetical protein
VRTPLAVLVAAALTLSTCVSDRDSTPPTASSATFIAADTAEAQYFADYRNHIESRHVAVYETRASYGDSDEKHRVTWYKDGNDRFRYDMEGDWSSADIQLSDLSLFIFGEPPVFLCSSDELLGPMGGCDGTGEGSGNFIYELAFPLGLPELEDIDNDTSDLEMAPVEYETIAGYEARCFSFSYGTDAHVRSCFTADGVQAAYSYTDSSGVVLKREIVELKEITEHDFELPYPLVTPAPE